MSGDRIELRGLRFMGTHGVLDFEQQIAQPFEVDLDVITDLTVAGVSDSVVDTVSYVDLIEAVKVVITNEHHALLERIAARIVEDLLRDDRIVAVDLTVRKLRPPVEAQLQSSAVHIIRQR